MSPVLRIAPVAALAIILSLAPPLALADEPTPPALSGRASNNGDNWSQRHGEDRWNDRSPVSYPAYKRSITSAAGRSESSTQSRRAGNLIRKGLRAERQGDMEAACQYYTQANQILSRGGASPAHSEQQMVRVCQA